MLWLRPIRTKPCRQERLQEEIWSLHCCPCHYVVAGISLSRLNHSTRIATLALGISLRKQEPRSLQHRLGQPLDICLKPPTRPWISKQHIMSNWASLHSTSVTPKVDSLLLHYPRLEGILSILNILGSNGGIRFGVFVLDSNTGILKLLAHRHNTKLLRRILGAATYLVMVSPSATAKKNIL